MIPTFRKRYVVLATAAIFLFILYRYECYDYPSIYTSLLRFFVLTSRHVKIGNMIVRTIKLV